MLIRKLLRLFLFGLSFRVAEDGGGGSPATPPAPPSDVSNGGADATGAPAAAPVTSPAPAPTMLDAINGYFDGQKTDPAAAPGQPRDPLGRFATKDAAGNPVPPPQVAAAVPGAPAAPAGQPAKPVVPAADDLTTMPEGLQPKAQERFQRMAETIKTTSAERDEARGQVNYMREQFQTHGVQQPQFEQAVAVIGMLNRGDYQGALAALDEQRRHIALLTGHALPGVDALSEHADLRQAVDNLQITEQHAMEIAKGRTRDAATQQAQQNQQRQQQQTMQEQQRVQQEEQAKQQAVSDVDALCQHLKATDMDFDAIEAQLAPAMKDLLAGVPPNMWKNAVQTQYSLLKRVASSARGSTPGATGGTLRPGGVSAGSAKPSSMFDAMWGPK